MYYVNHSQINQMVESLVFESVNKIDEANLKVANQANFELDLTEEIQSLSIFNHLILGFKDVFLGNSDQLNLLKFVV